MLHSFDLEHKKRKMKKNIQIFTKLFFLTLFILTTSCKSDDDSSQEEQQQEEGLIGNYSGTWNSDTSTGATFTDFAITVKITGESMSGDETVLSGEFFATSSYVSCCGSENDGTMVFRILNDEIISFNFNDQIVDCTGSFSGTGIVNSIGAFVIDFTGNDCDGDHVGQIIIKK